MPGLSALQVLGRVGNQAPNTKIIIISGHTDDAHVVELIEAGVSGFLAKDATAAHFRRAAREVMAGHAVLDPAIQDTVARQLKQRAVRRRPALSEQELRVLRLMADGFSAARIASELNIAQTTVRTHQRRLYEKLNVHDKASAVAAGIRLGLLS